MIMLIDFSLLPKDLLIVMDLFCKWCVFVCSALSVLGTGELFSAKIGFCAIQILVETDFTVIFTNKSVFSHALQRAKN
jgi:hypothetical protein